MVLWSDSYGSQGVHVADRTVPIGKGIGTPGRIQDAGTSHELKRIGRLRGARPWHALAAVPDFGVSSEG
jgi:hypothetical protein